MKAFIAHFAAKIRHRHSDGSGFPLLESLEPRMLRSAAIQVTGCGQTLVYGDFTPSAGDFTDFRFMSLSANRRIENKTKGRQKDGQ
jgi:hypothetical protein